MADEKKRGFHALEQRIHQMEEEDEKQEKVAAGQRGQEKPRAEPTDKRQQPAKK